MKNCLYNTTALAIVTLLVMAVPAAAYIIDGNCSDWGVYPINDSSTNQLIDNSLIPTMAGISYVIENDDADWACGVSGNNSSNFTGPEWWDLEAMYVDDDSEYIYVMIITSMPKNGMDWGSDHIQPGDLAFNFNDSGTFEYGVKIVQNDPEDGGFGEIGGIYLYPTWAVLDPDTDCTNITSIVSGTLANEKATIRYTGTGASGVTVPSGPSNSGLPWDTFGDPARYGYDNPPIPNEIIEIKIPKSALDMPTTTNIRSAITCENGVIKLESITLIPEFATLAIPVISLMGLIFYIRKREAK